MTESISTFQFILIFAIGILASNQFRLSSQFNAFQDKSNLQNTNQKDFEFHKKLIQKTNIRIAAIENSLTKSEIEFSALVKNIENAQKDISSTKQKVEDVNSLVENIIKKNILGRAAEMSKKYNLKKNKMSSKDKMSGKDKN